MKRFILIFLSILFFLNYPVNASEAVSKVPLSQISNQVIKSAKSLNFPSPKFEELGMVAFTKEKPTSVTYGHYRVDKVNSGLTSITTAATLTFETQDVAYNLFLRGFLDEGSTLKHELRSNGTGVSAGGLIELSGINQMNMKNSNNLKFLPAGFSRTMTIETKVTKLDKVSGQLFPLEVGNKLMIRLTSENSMEKGKNRTKILEFEITKEIKGYQLNNTELPGNVFEITIHSKQPKKGTNLPPTLLFSPHLGWVVESHFGNITSKVVGWN